MTTSSRISARTCKIAFCFLVRKNLNQLDIWLEFFRGHEDRFSVYFHVADLEGSDQGFTKEHTIDEHVDTKWGGDLYGAVRLLYASALTTESNCKVVLLSESTIPVRNFQYVYTYLTTHNKSHVGYTPRDSTGHNERATLKMMRQRFVKNSNRSETFSRYVDPQHWYFNEMWTILNREHAHLIANDAVIWKYFESAFAWDENYPMYILSVHNQKEIELERECCTFVNWAEAVVHGSSGGRSPKTYDRLTPKDFSRLWAVLHRPRFLFARKFSSTSNVGRYRHLLLGDREDTFPSQTPGLRRG
ncbi:beta-1,6-N-acetylglucosaminyltransferase, partial [bacterium]|nr:beta-1,6-N-acetylglucosaminyltransferase [bacterium]